MLLGSNHISYKPYVQDGDLRFADTYDPARECKYKLKIREAASLYVYLLEVKSSEIQLCESFVP